MKNKKLLIGLAVVLVAVVVGAVALTGSTGELQGRFVTRKALLTQPTVKTVTLANKNPAANAGPDQIVTDTDGDGFAMVTLDGSASHDLDGTIDFYGWSTASFRLPAGQVANVNLAVGTYEINLLVRDNDEATSNDTVIVTVEAEELLLPDLVPEITGVKKLIYPDTSTGTNYVQMSLIIHNIGSLSKPSDTERATSDFNYFINFTTSYDNGDPYVIERTLGSRYAERSIIQHFTINQDLAEEIRAGSNKTATLTVIADSDNVLTEENELNNSATYNFSLGTSTTGELEILYSK